MPRRTNQLTPNQRLFVDFYAATGDRNYSAEKAGFAVPASGASQSLALPKVLNEIRKERLKRLYSINEKGMNHFDAVLDDPKAPTKDKTRVAQIVLSEITKLEGDSPEDDAQPHSMTAEQLAKAADRARLALKAAEVELSNRAKDVTANHSQQEPKQEASAQHAPNCFD